MQAPYQISKYQNQTSDQQNIEQYLYLTMQFHANAPKYCVIEFDLYCQKML